MAVQTTDSRLFVFVCCRCICSLLTGNHDLEGMDEFETDEENLEAWMKHFNRDMPQFCTQVSSLTPSNDSTYSGHCICRISTKSVYLVQ